MNSAHSPGPPPHGTRSRYTAPHNCRCADCKQASARYNREWRRNNADRPIPDGATHGISTYQNWGCRCGTCKQAMADYHQRRKARGFVVGAGAYGATSPQDPTEGTTDTQPWR